MAGKPLYKRVLLKASGEALMGEQGFGIDVAVADRMASDIAAARGMGVEVGVVIGGGRRTQVHSHGAPATGNVPCARRRTLMTQAVRGASRRSGSAVNLPRTSTCAG